MPTLKSVFRVYPCVLTNSISCQGIKLQFVRYRKPRFVPTAPSKLYRVKEPTKVDPVEAEQLVKWQNNYNTEMKSIRSYLVNYQNQVEEKRKIITGQRKPFEEIFAEMTVMNDQWNAQTAVLKKEMYEENQRLIQERVEVVKEREEKERLQMLEKARRKVFQYKDQEHNFIQEKDLDDKIEELLNTKSDFNYALYLDGSTSMDEENKDLDNDSSKPSDSSVHKDSGLNIGQDHTQTDDKPGTKP